MQGKHDTIEPRSLDLFDRAGNFEGSWHENKYFAAIIFRLIQGVDGKLPRRFVHDFALQVLDRNRKRSASRSARPTRGEIFLQESSIKGGRHDHDLKIRPRLRLNLHRSSKSNISVEMP